MKILLIVSKLVRPFKKYHTGYCLSTVFTLVCLLMSFQSMSQAVQDDLLVRPESNGSLRLTSEKGIPIGPEIKYMPEWKAFGWFTSKDRVEWNVLVKKSGEYDVFLEWSVSDEEAGKPFVLEAGRKKLKAKIGKTGSWETFKVEKIGTVQLSSGKQTVVFKPDSKLTEGYLMDLREIKLEPIKTKTTDPKSVSVSTFRAAVVKKNITPSDSQHLLGFDERKSESVNDSLFHRIVALDDGLKQFFIVSTDLCLFSPSEYDKVAARLQKEHQIDPIDIWWTVTHTHSAPEVGVPGIYGTYLGDRIQHEVDTVYTAMVEQKLIDGILEARKNLEPASLGVGWGFSRANIRRRLLDSNGQASLRPDPNGPVDHRIGLIRIDKESGAPLALISNYAIHGTVLSGNNLQISGDVQGVVSNYVEKEIGVPLLFINGAAGDVTPIHRFTNNPQEGFLEKFHALLGDKIIEANQRLCYTTNKIKLRSGALTVETPRKPGLGWPTDLDAYTSNKDEIKMVRLPVRFLTINDDIAIWGAPLELFNTIATEVREDSPFQNTFFFGYTNGWLGYLPTASAWPHGGYEVNAVSPFTPVAEKELKEAVLGYFRRVGKK
jgi:neutral ceramidase